MFPINRPKFRHYGKHENLRVLNVIFFFSISLFCCYSDHSISTRVERLDEAIMEASRALRGEPSGLWQYSETSCWMRETRRDNYILKYTIIHYYELRLRLLLLLLLFNNIIYVHDVQYICVCSRRIETSNNFVYARTWRRTKIVYITSSNHIFLYINNVYVT